MPPLLVLWIVLSGAAHGLEPSAHWTFDDGDTSRIADAGPHGLHGTAAGVKSVQGPPGAGRALRFSGGGRVRVPTSAATAFDSTESFSVSLLLRVSPSLGFSTLLMTKDRPGGIVSYSFTLGREPGKPALELWSWQRTKLLSRQRVDDGRWHRVLGCYDARSNLAMLFVDGDLQSLAAAGHGGPQEVSLCLGNNLDADQPFSGELDDVLIAVGIPEEARIVTDQARLWTLLGEDEIKTAQQAYLDRMAAPKFFQAQTAEEWQAHAAEVRGHVLTCLGLWPLPQRVALSPHVSGTLDRDGYTLQRIYWQTWPGYYAGGYLYMPKEARFPAPGILCPHGHFENGARHPTVQARLIGLARKGYVVLAVDSVHAYNWAAGLVPMTVMAWNNIRGVDLLCSLPEVDPDRLGCTGCSGGGQQTFYMMAIEDRLDVAIPVCMVSEFRRILSIDSHHCMCNHVPGILTKTDTPELAARFAPGPALLICVTQDWTAWLPQEGYPEIRGVYELFGRGDDVVCTQYDWQHDYSLPMREEAYAWFNRYLMEIGDPAAAREPEHTPETLETLAGLDGPPEGSVGPETIAADILARQGADLSLPGTDLDGRLASIRAGFVALTNEAEVTDGERYRTIGEPRTEDGVRVERIAVRSEQEIDAPVVVLSATGQRDGEKRPAVVLVGGEGKLQLLTARREFVTALVESGLVVCVADPRGYGELSVNRGPQDMNGVVFGRPELAVAAHDVTRVAAYLRGREDVDPARVGCVGYGEGAVIALAAAIYDPSLAPVAALELGDTYSASDRRPRAPRLLTVGDLPQLAATLIPRPLWIQGAAQEESFDWTKQAYERSDASGFRLTADEVTGAELAGWLGEAR